MMSAYSQSSQGIILAFLGSCLFLLLSFNQVFFWDSVQLSSKQAQYYYENGLFGFFLPEELDSGHPPLVGMYLCLYWLIFKKSLFVSHLAFFPFVFIYIYLIWKMAHLFIQDKSIRFLWIFILVTEPIFLSQSIIMSPDTILVSAFLSLAYSYYTSDFKWMLLGGILLPLVSMRGAMVLFAFGLFVIFEHLVIKKEKWKELIKTYAPIWIGGTVFMGFLIVHFLHVRWIGFHSDSPWSSSFSRVNAIGIGKNLLIFLYRWIESGKVLLLLLLIYLLYTTSALTR